MANERKSWQELAEEKTTLTYYNNNKIKISNAILLGGNFRNFSCKTKQFRTNRPTFNIAIPVREIDRLREYGYYIRTLTPQNPGDDPTYHLQIKVNSLSRLILITEWNGKKRGHEMPPEDYKDLDTMMFERVDLVIKPNHDEEHNTVTAWLTDDENRFYKRKSFDPFEGDRDFELDGNNSDDGEEMPFSD